MKKLYTMTWSRSKAQFVATVRKPNSSKWMKKWIPRGKFQEHQNLEAESWLISWLSEFTKTSIAPVNTQVITKKTLALYLPKWLELRKKSVGTGINTYKIFTRTVNCWILDNPKFSHKSVQNLDLTSELCQVATLREWIDSLSGALSSKFQTINTLSVFFNDAVAEGWLDEDFVNPMQKRAIANLIKDMRALQKKTAEIKILPWDQLELLLQKQPGLKKIRRFRYLLAVGTGLRLSELQALVWSDIHLDEAVPYLEVSRQLLWRGQKPWRVYEKELARGKDKTTILSGDNAVVSDPKTYSSKGVIPLHPILVQALRERFRKTKWKAPDDPVITRNGRFYQTQAVVFRKDLKRCNITTDVTFHAMRRTFSSKLASLGVDDGTIDRLLRHSKKSTARVHYIKDQLDPLYAAVCKLPLGSGTTKHVAERAEKWADSPTEECTRSTASERCSRNTSWRPST